MILSTKRRTKENLELALQISKKKAYDAFEYVAVLEGKVGSSIKRHPKPGISDIMIRQRHIKTLQR